MADEYGSEVEFADEPASGVKPDKDERMWGMLCHLSSFAGFLFPFGNIIGPLVVWLLKKDQYTLVEDQGREALNFQISITIYFFVSIVLVFLLIGIPLLIAVTIFDIVATIIAAIKSNEGTYYRYPLTIRLI